MRFFSCVSIFLYLCSCDPLAFAGDFTIEDDGGRVMISERGQAVLGYTYNSEVPSSGDGTSQAPRLLNYFHPLYGLYGEVLTGEAASNWSGAPGISWVWTRLGVEGRGIDLSTEAGGKREFERISRANTTEDRVAFGVQNVWISQPEGKAQVLENISFTVGKVTEGQRNIDLTIVLRSVSTGTIYLEGSIPGAGLDFQFNSERKGWSVSGGQGEISPQAASYLSPWVVCSYRDDRRSTRSGLAVFQDGRNPGFSQPNWLVEAPDRLTAGVPETVKAELKPGQALEFRYRLILYHLGSSKVDMTTAYAKFMAEGQGQN